MCSSFSPFRLSLYKWSSWSAWNTLGETSNNYRVMAGTGPWATCSSTRDGHVSFDIEAGHFIVTDLDPLRVGPGIEFASTVKPVLVVVEAISSITANRLVSGVPRQV